ncbi:MAG TPA: heme-binding protein [Planctomycetota bacterium]|nr:heme-binding protein [Planctomycetota bacterium]
MSGIVQLGLVGLFAPAPLLVAQDAGPQDPATQPPTVEQRQQAAKLLKAGLDRATSPELLEAVLLELPASADALGSGRNAEELRRMALDLRWQALVDPDQAFQTARTQVSERIKDLVFEPRIEADLPVGWPTPTVVGEVQWKRYPAYRMGQTDARSARSNGAFWILFQHIQSNDIPMTAPVEMTFEPNGKRMAETKMAFLYQSTDVGQLGQEGDVTVTDVPAGFALSLGCRGAMRTNGMGEQLAVLEQWLERHPDWTAAGPMRVMGYNSPMVPYNQRYFEVELPVRRKQIRDPAEAQEAQTAQ